MKGDSGCNEGAVDSKVRQRECEKREEELVNVGLAISEGPDAGMNEEDVSGDPN